MGARLLFGVPGTASPCPCTCWDACLRVGASLGTSACADELSPARGRALQKSLQQRGRVFVAFQDVRSACGMLCGAAGTNLLGIAQAASDLQAEPPSTLQRMRVSRKQLSEGLLAGGC